MQNITLLSIFHCRIILSFEVCFRIYFITKTSHMPILVCNMYTDCYRSCIENIRYLFSGDYLAALETFLEISMALEKIPSNGSRSELLLKCEISCVFLLLILRPSPQKIVPELAKILERYNWGDKNDPVLKGS